MCVSCRKTKKGEHLDGNERFEGFSKDLIDSIAQIVPFKYRFEIAEGNANGAYNKTSKKWNGLVKQLLDRVGITGTIW